MSTDRPARRPRGGSSVRFGPPVALGLLAMNMLAACSGSGSNAQVTASPRPDPSATAPSSSTPSASLTAAQAGFAIAATISVPTPRDVMGAFDSLWVSNGPGMSVTRIDPASSKALAVIPVADPASVLSSGAGSVWLTSYPGNSLTRIDPKTNKVTGRMSLLPKGAGPVGVTFLDGFVWVANHDGVPTSSVAKVDPATLKILDVIPVGSSDSAGPSWLSGAGGALWTDVPDLAAVVRIDPKTDTITATIPVSGACAMLLATADSVWVAGGSGDGCPGGVTRIDPATNTVTTVLSKAGAAGSLALLGGKLWYGTADGFVGRIDAASSTLLGRFRVTGDAFGETAAFGFVWVTDTDAGALYKLAPQ